MPTERVRLRAVAVPFTSQKPGRRGQGAHQLPCRSGVSVGSVCLPTPFGRGLGIWPGFRQAGVSVSGCRVRTHGSLGSLPSTLRPRHLRRTSSRCSSRLSCHAPSSVLVGNRHTTWCIRFLRLLEQVTSSLAVDNTELFLDSSGSQELDMG